MMQPLLPSVIAPGVNNVLRKTSFIHVYTAGILDNGNDGLIKLWKKSPLSCLNATHYDNSKKGGSADIAVIRQPFPIELIQNKSNALLINFTGTTVFQTIDVGQVAEIKEGKINKRFDAHMLPLSAAGANSIGKAMMQMPTHLLFTSHPTIKTYDDKLRELYKGNELRESVESQQFTIANIVNNFRITQYETEFDGQNKLNVDKFNKCFPLYNPQQTVDYVEAVLQALYETCLRKGNSHDFEQSYESKLKAVYQRQFHQWNNNRPQS